MARDAAYRQAEEKIEAARRSGAKELDLSCKWNTDASEKLTELPESLGQLTQLQALNLSYNQLTALPEWLGQLTQLQALNLSDNQLTALPESLGRLRKLESLHINDNRIQSLPESLCNLRELTRLWVFRNQLRSLPSQIGELESLKRLDMNGNQIGRLPSSFGELSALRTLVIGSVRGAGSNKFNGVPKQLEYLTDIEHLWLDKCEISDLPRWFLQLKNLHTLTLLDNPLNPELAAAYEQGLDAVKAYLRAKAEDQIVLNEAKLILIGEGDVGKTSLLGALRGDQWVENRPTTHGVEVKIKSLVLDVPPYDGLPRPSESSEPAESTALEGHRTEPKQITLNGWDFGGQNIYRHTHQLFFTAPAVYLAVWNPRRGPEQCCVDEWIKMVRQRAYDETRPNDRPRILVVATHGGPKERLDHIDQQLLRDEFGDLIAGFHHVDSRTGYGLDELKTAIAREAAAIPSVGRSVPKSWKNLLDALQERSKRDPYISYKQFLAVCHSQRITDELAATYAAILNELGYLIHYQNDEVLQDTVILKPEYISKAISYMLEDHQTKDDNGLVAHQRLSEIWNDPDRPAPDRYPAELHRIFLRLMGRFDLSYQVAMPKEDDPATSLIAQLVPGGRPQNWEQAWPDKPERDDAERRRICRIVDVETGRPAEVDGLLYRLIVRLHRYSLGRRNYFESRHWKTGMILDDNFNGRAFIEEIAGDVYVTVRAAYPDGFLGSLCNEVRSLVDQFWKGLDCRLSVPCHAPCRGVHELEELIETQREGIAKVRCSVCKKFFNINSLLVAATPKLPMDVVLAQLTKVRGELANLKDGVFSLDTDVRAMIGQANEQFELFMNALTDPAKDGPRLFSFEPVKPGFWDKPKWIAEKFRLTLWCEHSRLPLPMLTGKKKLGVYEVELTKDWVKRSAPFLKVLSGTLSLALPIAAPAAKLAMNAAAFDAIENQLDFGKACAESFLDAGQHVGDWLSSDDTTQVESGRAVLAQGAMLRELHALLKEMDKAGGFGGLVRVQNKRREFLWVHPQFVHEY